MKCFLKPTLEYYEAQDDLRQHPLDQEVPQRPSYLHVPQINGGGLFVAWVPNQPAVDEKARVDEIDTTLAAANIFGSTLAQLKAMSVAQFTTWFNANVTDLATARTVLRWVVLILVRKVL